MFDSVMVDCPKCGEVEGIEFQSKSGECLLHRYTVDSAPVEVLVGVHKGYASSCNKCGESYYPKLMKREIIIGLKAVKDLSDMD